MSEASNRRLLGAAWTLLILGFIGALASIRALWRGDNSDPNLLATILVVVPYIAAGMLLKITGKARLVLIAFFLPALLDVIFGCAFSFGRDPGWEAEIIWRAVRSLTSVFLLPVALGVGLWLDRLDAREQRES